MALSICLYKDYITSYCHCWSSTLSETSSGGDQEWGILCSGTKWQHRPSDRYFQGKILWAQFLHRLVSRKARKAQKSFLVMSASHDRKRQPSIKCVLGCMYLHFHQNHIFTDLSPYLFGEVFQSFWNAASWAMVLILSQIKFNSQLSYCAFLKIW